MDIVDDIDGRVQWAKGPSCGLHRVERLMRQQGLKARTI